MPSKLLTTLSGHVQLREFYDEELVHKELEEIGLDGSIIGASNPWYYRRKDRDTWIQIGESSDQMANFPMSWDTSRLENGDYEVLGLMHIFVRHGHLIDIIARQRIADVTIHN